MWSKDEERYLRIRTWIYYSNKWEIHGSCVDNETKRYAICLSVSLYIYSCNVSPIKLINCLGFLLFKYWIKENILKE